MIQEAMGGVLYYGGPGFPCLLVCTGRSTSRVTGDPTNGSSRRCLLMARGTGGLVPGAWCLVPYVVVDFWRYPNFFMAELQVENVSGGGGKYAVEWLPAI